MSTGMQTGGPGPSPSGLADVIDTILDKGLVIDAYVRVSLVRIELLTIDARIVIASGDTYLPFAQAGQGDQREAEAAGGEGDQLEAADRHIRLRDSSRRRGADIRDARRG